MGINNTITLSLSFLLLFVKLSLSTEQSPSEDCLSRDIEYILKIYNSNEKDFYHLTNKFYQESKKQQISDNPECLNSFEKYAIVTEICGHVGTADYYEDALEILYKHYLSQKNYFWAKYTLVKLNGMADENKPFPYKSRAVLNPPKAVDTFELSGFKFIVDEKKTFVKNLIVEKEPEHVCFNNDKKLAENTMFDIWTLKQVFINDITIVFDSSDGNILRCWTDERNDKIKVVEDNKVIFSDLNVNKFIRINAICQSAPIIIRKIVFNSMEHW